MKILFVTWDGPQVSYLEGLFLPIFRRLADYGWEFHVLQFSWGATERLRQSRKACESAGIPYRAVRVCRRAVPVGPLFTLANGARQVRRAMRHWNIDVVMPRSTLPALLTLLAVRGEATEMIFDADGLPLDERVDFDGLSSCSLVYRFLRDVEAQAVRRAGVVLTRSSIAAGILHARAGAGTSLERFRVVSNGRDAERFAPKNAQLRKSARDHLGIGDEAPLLVYAGSLGEQYCLPEMLTLFEQVLVPRPDAHLLILTGSPELVEDELRHLPRIESSASVLTVAPNEVPIYLASSDLGLALRAPSFSMQAVAPIKMGEYLLCGLPVVATAGIGDSGGLPDEVRFLLNNFDNESTEQAAAWFVNTVLCQREWMRWRCRDIGIKRFSLEASVESYGQALSYLGYVANGSKSVGETGSNV